MVGQSARAATLTVTTTADSGAGSLRQAIADANNGDTITFAAGLSGQTITISSSRMVITKTLTIDGSSLSTALTVNGGQLKQLFSVSATGVLSLTHLTLANGKGNYGAAIYNEGTVFLDRVTLHNHEALQGGALYNVGTLTLHNSTLSGNRAFGGGAIDNYRTLTIKNSTFHANHANNNGGALYNAGTLYLYNSILAGSSSGGDCHNAQDPFFQLVGTIAVNQQNLTEDGSCSAALSGDPKLAALALVDGVLVHQPTAESPVLDAGDNATCLLVDQRNQPRPQGDGCELGAFEVTAPTNSTDQVSQLSYSAQYSMSPQPCATVEAPGLPRHTVIPSIQSDSTIGYRDLYFEVTELAYTANQGDHSPLLCNADGGNGGTVGDRLTLAPVGALADNLLSPGEVFTQTVLVGLPVRARYRVFVDLYGTPVNPTSADTLLADAVQRIGRLGWEFDPESDLIDSTQRIFLPFTVR
jgi:hypothetical protein